MVLDGIDFDFNPLLSLDALDVFLTDYYFLIVLGMYTIFLALIKGNKNALYVQCLVLLSLWFQHWLSDTFFFIVFEYEWFAMIDAFMFTSFTFVLVLSLLLLCLEIRKQLEEMPNYTLNKKFPFKLY